MTKQVPRYSVFAMEDSWSYVLRDGALYGNGPWRYRWEAEEEADRLNADDGEREDQEKK